MSDYVRKKCVRFKIPQNIIDKFKNEDEWLGDLLLKEYNVKENYHTKNDFTINSGLNYENDEYEYFLDYQLDYEYGASGDFENIEYVEENNKCPKCGSKRISICKGIEISVEENLSTGKVLSRSKSGTTTFWIYKCRKCGWLSETCSK